MVTKFTLAAGGVVVALAVALMVGVALAPATHGPDSTVGTPGPSLTTSVQPNTGGPNESIRVHGQWVIEVREPNGTVVSRREFENALVPNGLLAKFLSRTNSVGFWGITLFGGPPGPCATADQCFIGEPGAGVSGSNIFLTLNVSAPTSGPNAGKLILSGTATADQDGSVGRVLTANTPCAPTTAPASPCPMSGLTGFTETTLSTPIAVSAGQQILVTVSVSFQ